MNTWKIILDTATIISGVAALLFFWERIRQKERTTKKERLHIFEKLFTKSNKKTIVSFELEDQVVSLFCILGGSFFSVFIVVFGWFSIAGFLILFLALITIAGFLDEKYGGIWFSVCRGSLFLLLFTIAIGNVCVALEKYFSINIQSWYLGIVFVLASLGYGYFVPSWYEKNMGM